MLKLADNPTLIAIQKSVPHAVKVHYARVDGARRAAKTRAFNKACGRRSDGAIIRPIPEPR